ncbi:MAG TPA: ATP-binding cassette domain-containing protein [Bryobacteraceae bacterium]|nr:ATP-binding cassette domain-containing protein [Bryobacteraceae bacterium]
MSLEPPLIEFERISVMRGSTLALDDISLKLGAGEHAAIIGPNGCGKSTFIKVITRECYPLIREDSRLSILGQDRWNIFELRSQLGIVSNDLMTLCIRDLTGMDMVLSGFFSSIGIWPNHNVTAEMRERARFALEKLEVPHLADRCTDQMSSGEGRRVLLARALVHEPRALILDEPSTALDLFAQHELRQILRKLAQSGIGIVMVTHHLSDLIPEIERVVLMQRGRIVADGPKREILTAGRLSKVFGLPVNLAKRRGYYNLW